MWKLTQVKSYVIITFNFLECCCAGKPAPYIDWESVTTIPLFNCQLIQAAVNLFGSCSGIPGQW